MCILYLRSAADFLDELLRLDEGIYSIYFCDSLTGAVLNREYLNYESVYTRNLSLVQFQWSYS
jgi:hypothetical protein